MTEEQNKPEDQVEETLAAEETAATENSVDPDC